MPQQPVVGIISPGEMGHAIGAVLQQHGLRVITNLYGRSQRTATLASQAGIIDVGDDETLVQQADVLLSILIPSQAHSFARRIAAVVQKTHTSTLFVECNAIAPRTIQAIEQLFASTSTNVVDAGIVGGPPRMGGSTPHIYASGAQAEQLTVLNNYGLDIRVLGPDIGQASGLKMCNASLTKGITALVTEAFTASQALGLADTFISELQTSQSVLFNLFKNLVPSAPLNAYRWISEVEEIAHTFSDLGLPPQTMEGAVDLYRFIEQTMPGAEIPRPDQPGLSLEDVISILAANLKKDKSAS